MGGKNVGSRPKRRDLENIVREEKQKLRRGLPNAHLRARPGELGVDIVSLGRSGRGKQGEHREGEERPRTHGAKMVARGSKHVPGRPRQGTKYLSTVDYQYTQLNPREGFEER